MVYAKTKMYILNLLCLYNKCTYVVCADTDRDRHFARARALGLLGLASGHLLLGGGNIVGGEEDGADILDVCIIVAARR